MCDMPQMHYFDAHIFKCYKSLLTHTLGLIIHVLNNPSTYLHDDLCFNIQTTTCTKLCCKLRFRIWYLNFLILFFLGGGAHQLCNKSNELSFI